MPTKLGAHAYLVNLYLHEFLEPILFLDPMDYSLWSEKNLANLKSSKISKTGEAIPTKLGAHAYLINLYLYDFFNRFF